MLSKIKRWRERRALDRELRSLPIPEQLQIPGSSQVEQSSALVSRQDIRAVAVSVLLGTAAILPVAGWGAYATEVYEDRAAHAQAEAAYSQALSKYEGAKAVESQGEAAPSDPLEAVEASMTPTTPAGESAASDLQAAEAAMEATEPPGIAELWPL